MTATQYPQPTTFRVVARGLLRRCPRCGGGKLFDSWLKMKDRCPTCGMKYERDEGFFLGAFTTSLGAVILALMIYIGVAIALTLPDPDPVRISVGAVIVAIVVPLVSYPFSRTLWSAIGLAMKPLEPNEVESAEAAHRGPEPR